MFKCRKKTVRLGFEESSYDTIVGNCHQFRDFLDSEMAAHRSLFPNQMQELGYKLHDIQYSKRQNLYYRRIKVKGDSERGSFVLSILPSFVMPYMVCRTELAEKVLRLRYGGTSYEDICQTLGGTACQWERMEQSLGHFNIVQTTLKDADRLPEHYAADEKITWHLGKEAYVAMTCAEDCVWGIGLSLDENEQGLTQAYGDFAQEVRSLRPQFSPQSVLADGWAATRKAWLNLFPKITLLLCFLHGVLKIRSCCKQHKAVWSTIQKALWDAYKATDKAEFLLKMTAFKQIAIDALNAIDKTDFLIQMIEKMYQKADLYAQNWTLKNAYKTSNMVDRQMRASDKYLFNTQYFHGNLQAARLKLRAWALIHNFKHYSQRTLDDKKANKQTIYKSRFHKINGFVYHDSWLQNLLIAGVKVKFLTAT